MYTKERLLPFPSTSGCLHDCKLRIPASAFPAEMTAHESQEQARMLSTRYTEFLADLQRAYGKPPDEKPSATEFIVYCRQQAHESAALIDGEQRCNVAESGPGALHPGGCARALGACCSVRSFRCRRQRAALSFCRDATYSTKASAASLSPSWTRS